MLRVRTQSHFVLEQRRDQRRLTPLRVDDIRDATSEVKKHRTDGIHEWRGAQAARVRVELFQSESVLETWRAGGRSLSAHALSPLAERRFAKSHAYDEAEPH